MITLPKRWPSKPDGGAQCQARWPGRDFMGPRTFRCTDVADETVITTQGNVLFVCSLHALVLWKRGTVARKPRVFGKENAWCEPKDYDAEDD